jgi:hypothetical protein
MICTKCKHDKPLTNFWKDNRRTSKLAAWCKACKYSDQKRIRAANPEKHKERERRRYWNNRDSERERHLVRKYGITLADYAELLAQQGGKCAICEAPEPANKTLDVDHDHKTGEVRGLLCTSCNRMLGHSEDSEVRLIGGAKYLSSRKSRRHS